MTKIMTVGDVRDAKRAADDAMWARSDAAQAKAALAAGTWMPQDPRIGVLCRGGAPVYYAYVAGIYCESTQLHAITSTLAAQELTA